MHKPALLYVSINDGSDTRINKEIHTLATAFDIYYLGIGKSTEKAFVRTLCKKFYLVKGHHKNSFTLSKFYLLFLRVYSTHSFQSIHVKTSSFTAPMRICMTWRLFACEA